MSAFLQFCRENIVAVVIVLIAAIAGGVLCVHFEIGDMSPLGRAFAGAFAGGWFGLFPLGFRLYES